MNKKEEEDGEAATETFKFPKGGSPTEQASFDPWPIAL
jgi:hypothetical protein